MTICCAFGCSNKPNNCWKTFHTFPFSRPSICQLWILNVRREKWEPNKRTLICSDHFEDHCFVRTGKIVRLKPDAVPTKFSYPERLKKVTKSRPPPKVRTEFQHESSHHAEAVELETDPSDILEKIMKNAAHDHDYSSPVSPRQQDIINRIRQKHRDVLKKLALAKQSSQRMLRKVDSLQEIVDDLKSKFLLSSNCESMLQKTYGNVLGGVIERKQRNMKISGKSKRWYSPELRSFALTLQFYSSKAYNYVRKSFDLCLPHPSALRNWYSSVDAEPGFCHEAFAALKMKTGLSTGSTLCSMMLDEMAIRKHVEWDGKRFRGYVDIGVDIDDDDLPVATDALVFMVVAVNGGWKVPIAYFLVAGMSGEERANLVRQALLKLSEIGVTVVSLTCDGPSCHFSMAHALGANLILPDPVPWFPHPQKPDLKICLFLDICHMLKLLRNALADMEILRDGAGDEIKWLYIELLYELQQQEGLRAGNKLRSAHLQWRKQAMKVHLAAQTISSSVADALEFCAVDLGLPQFAGAHATIKFLRTFDRLFDLHNSRNPFAKGYKAPMKPSNQFWWRPFMEQACSYILQLSDKNGNLLYKSRRKTAFVGFYISTLSVLQIYDDYVVTQAKLKYLLTYKFSQDHLELFFAAVRSRGGRNNNPTAAQFKAAFKRLLVRHEVQCANGNVVAQDATRILHALRDSETGVKDPIDIVDISQIRLYDLTPTVDYEDANISMPDFDRLSQYSENVVSYIAGFVVRMVKARIHCRDCLSALEPDTPDTTNRPLQLIQRKTRGGLVTASAGVELVCRSTERCVRLLMKGRGMIPNQPALVSSMCLTVLKDTCGRTLPVFPSLSEHMFDTAPDQNHVYRLVSVIATCYLKIRLHHLAKSHTEKLTGEPVRRKLAKLILSKHQ